MGGERSASGEELSRKRVDIQRGWFGQGIERQGFGRPGTGESRTVPGGSGVGVAVVSGVGLAAETDSKRGAGRGVGVALATGVVSGCGSHAAPIRATNKIKKRAGAGVFLAEVGMPYWP